MHAASRHGTPSLTSLPKDDEMICEVRPPSRGGAYPEKVGWKRDKIDEQKVYLTILMSFLRRIE